jgi:hypothetical protein
MGQARPTINLNAFGDGDPVWGQPHQQPPLQVRSIPEILEEMLSRTAPGLLLELRESFQQDLEDLAIRRAAGSDVDYVPHVAVWKTIAGHLRLPELSGGGY